MVDIIIIAIVFILVFAASYYLYKQKKNGTGCMGGPSAGVCTRKSCGGWGGDKEN